jgi:ABC-type branched-subunit amino acid transport system substrate-binding protein
MRKKTISIISLTALSAAVIGAFLASTIKERNNNYIVGTVLPLTGDLAFFGQPQKYAIQMAKADLENSGVLQKNMLEIQIEDSRSTAKDGLSAVRKLLPSRPKAVVTSLTLVSLPAVPILSGLSIPQIALSVDPDIQNRAPRVYRLYYGFEDEMKAIADYAIRRKAKSVAIAWINTPELQSSIDTILKPQLKLAGITLVGSSPHTFTTSDFRSTMASFADKKPDLVILQDFGLLLPAMVEAARSQGLQDLVGGIGFMSSSEKDRSKLANIPFALPKFLVEDTQGFQEFERRFKNISGGKSATYDVVFTYDAISILGTAISGSQKSGKDLNSILANTSRFKGIAGDLTIEDRAMRVPLSWGVFSPNGELVPFQETKS